MTGFCKIRIITMTMRIVWSSYSRNVSVAIAAQVFVYVGTIILFIINHFLTQRVVRAQHPRWGWSQPYRIFHRASLVGLILTLLMIIISSIQQFFTLDPNTHRIDRDLQLTGQTYFAAFCFAPIPLVLLSLILPRKGTEKFGAGRLRNNIAILLAAATILSIGAIFRCVINWLPPRPLFDEQRNPTEEPWYFSKACFYIFNFTIEIIVVIFFAITRIDLRFHVPNGAKGPGAYRAGRSPQHKVEVVGNEKNLKRKSKVSERVNHPNTSTDTLEEYPSSLFDDSKTLADSLRHPSSVLEVDPKTGHWKLKRASAVPSIRSRYSGASEPSLWSPDRDTYISAEAPPMPELPSNWPLRESQLPTSSVPVMEHQNRRSDWSVATSNSDSKRSHDISGHDMNGVDMSNTVAAAMTKLEANSDVNKKQLSDSQLDADAITPVDPRLSFNFFPPKKTYQPGTDLRSKRSHRFSTTPSSTSSYAPAEQSHTSASASDAVPFAPTPFVPIQRNQSSRTSYGRDAPQSPTSTAYDTAEEEFARFSYEAPSRPGDLGYDGNNDDVERSLSRGREPEQ
jgi:hypothetical protein